MNAARLLLAGLVSLLWNSPMVSAASVPELVNLVSQAQYRHYLDDLLYTHTGDDRAYGPEHDLARCNIVDQFTTFGLQVTLEPFIYEESTYYNIVGVLPGKGARSNEVYLVSGHYDSAETDEEIGVPGADDDASGVAGMLEAARVLSQQEFEATLVFVAFDREEDDVVGSTEYVASHKNQQIKGMIALDMIANNSATNRPEICCLESSKSMMLALSNAFALYGGGLAVSYGGPETNADHYSFELGGFPACLLFEGGSNQWYHTLDDSVDTPNYIDYEFATQMTRATVGYLATQASPVNDSPVPLQLAKPSILPDGSFAFEVSGEEGKTVVLQASTDLAIWQEMASQILQDRPTQISIANPASDPKRFFRAIVSKP